MAGKKLTQKRKKALKKEAQIKLACQGLSDGIYTSPEHAASELGITKQARTIQRRFFGETDECRAAHQSQELLTEAQTEVLKLWTRFLSLQGFPLSKKTMGPMVEELCGQSPSEKNFKAFIEHNPDLTLGHPSGLDPKHAQAFNYPSVKAHFDLLQDTINLNDIPTCNIFNMCYARSRE